MRWFCPRWLLSVHNSARLLIDMITNIEEVWPPIHYPVAESYVFQFHGWDCLECWAEVNKLWFHTCKCWNASSKSGLLLGSPADMTPASLKNWNGCACNVNVIWLGLMEMLLWYIWYIQIWTYQWFAEIQEKYYSGDWAATFVSIFAATKWFVFLNIWGVFCQSRSSFVTKYNTPILYI